jgi:hypothetical protein
MKVSKTALLLLVAVFAVACATRTRQSIDFDTTVDFTSKKTLAFFEDTEGGADDPAGSPRDLTRKAIDRELRASGHRFVRPSGASLLVIYHVTTRKKSRPNGMITGEGALEGVMVISFRDPNTKRSVWYGTGEVTVDSGTNAKREIDRISKSLLVNFPPPPGMKSADPMGDN